MDLIRLASGLDPDSVFGPKLREAGGAGEPGCQCQASGAPATLYSCRKMTMSAFAGELRGIAGDYLTSPAVDATGIEGSI